ncbi:DUF1294 domain-containing protein [Flavobacterium cellulosilyticum]|uniref:DUF1294 domain-containing protein n=1 Tax=Flavobacterium cellulosilyticum TaxID=2541731 RepID=A0A4R5CHG5_9FLAO|nr:DUF1294 domain-containing protein [Flavobacterium cellulosilyticum]TDD99638.1 DUF1294 domain-containing protein [Flavobacterium cellulosilyticum]
MNVIFYSFLILNAIAFVLVGYDKYLAKAQKNRISERTLLGFVFVGGTIGSGLAMFIFSHKTSKNSYLWKYWGIVIFQFLLTFLWFYFKLFK